MNQTFSNVTRPSTAARRTGDGGATTFGVVSRSRKMRSDQAIAAWGGPLDDPDAPGLESLVEDRVAGPGADDHQVEVEVRARHLPSNLPVAGGEPKRQP